MPSSRVAAPAPAFPPAVPPKKKRKKAKQPNFLKTAIISCVILGVTVVIAPSKLPFRPFEFWRIDGNPLQWIMSAWPLFAWFFGLNFLVSVFTRNSREMNRDAEGFLAKGFLISVWAGVMEEICHRWLIFFCSIILTKMGNAVFFGWLSGLINAVFDTSLHFGLAEFFQVYIAGPIANFFTLGTMETYLNTRENWAIGAAITVHVCIDMLAFSVRYVDAVIERQRGFA